MTNLTMTKIKIVLNYTVGILTLLCSFYEYQKQHEQNTIPPGE